MRITCHMRRAVLISEHIGANAMTAAAMADTLDRLAAGVFFLNADCETLQANASGHAMPSESRVLRSIRGKLTMSRGNPAPASGELARLGTVRPGQFCLADAAAPGAEIYFAHIFPVTAYSKESTGCNPAVNGMMVHEVQLDASDSVTRLARHYRLSPRE